MSISRTPLASLPSNESYSLLLTGDESVTAPYHVRTILQYIFQNHIITLVPVISTRGSDTKL